MTNKRSLALAALLVFGISATTGLARRNPEEQLTEKTMLAKTCWMGVKVALLHQYLTQIAPLMKDQVRSVTNDSAATDIIMDAAAAAWFVDQMKDYFACVGDYVWETVGEPVANQLPDPVRSLVCDC